MAVSPTEIIFSPDVQQALLGHAVSNSKVFETAQAMGVTSPWFYNANHQSIWQALDEFERKYHRHPSIPELKSTAAFTVEEVKVKAARSKALEQALAGRTEVAFDAIVGELREWSKGQTFVKGMETASDLYNRKDVATAYALVAKMNLDIERIDQQGLQQRSLPSSERVDGERQERIEQRGKVMHYGISFLDDATGGIGLNDVVLIGAKPGVGKTQLVTDIASHNVLDGKRVTLFALEAEPNEIERRMKFSLLSKFYRATKLANPKPVNYRDWRRGEFDEDLQPFEDQVNSYFREKYANLRTIYKGWGEYGILDLERDIVKLAPTTDLIIVDHLHYIDTDGENENHEMKQIVKTLRDLALLLCKPIILVAHMRKTLGGRKSTPLVPDLEDFHGSSDIIKIATTAIILAPCYENWKMFTAPSMIPSKFFKDPETKQVRARLWATYVRVAKCRLDGSIVRYCAVTFFDDESGKYRPQYALGRLISGDCHWEPEDQRPYWAKNAVLSLKATND